MMLSESVLKNDEQAIYQLRSIYRQYGYSLYKVSKFEEYDLYAHNKSFLVSQNILSFTDTNGKLMALKPDVTLSIVKNISDDSKETHKLCYNETVYRTSAGSDGFREIIQTGIECIGTVDVYAESEIVLLALKSLDAISANNILDISHMGVLDGLLNEFDIVGSSREELIHLVESKNVHSIKSYCKKSGIPVELCQRLCALTELYLPIHKALPALKEIVYGEKSVAAYEKLKALCDFLSSDNVCERLYLDFSIVNDFNYYDGICFKGFIEGIPESVLSGGRYDPLLAKLGKHQSAIGFAVYLDRLERMSANEAPYDIDTVILYDGTTPISLIKETQTSLLNCGEQVMTVTEIPTSIRYKKLINLTNGGSEYLEEND